MKTVVVTVPGMVSDSDLAPLREVSDVKYVELASITQEKLCDLCDGFDFLMLNYDVIKHLDEAFYAHKNIQALKGISLDITGLDWANPHFAKKHGVTLFNTPYYSTESVAETIVAEILLHSRNSHLAYQDEIAGKEPVARKGINLLGKKAGIVGLGHIGTRTAELLGAFGMEVFGWNRSPKQVEGVTNLSLDELFSECDVICICLKLTKEGSEATEGIIGKRLFEKMRPGAILVNLAGRELVNHDELYPFLKSGRVRGYSTTRKDVMKEHKIANIASVHLPPSDAWFSDESLDELRHTWVQNVIGTIKGEPENIFKD